MYPLGVIRFPESCKEIKLIGKMERIFPNCLIEYALEKSPIMSNTVTLESLGMLVQEIQFPYFIIGKAKLSELRFKRAVRRTTDFLSAKGITEIILDEKNPDLDLKGAFLNQGKELKIIDKTDFYGIFISEILKYICKNMGIKLQSLPVTLILDDMDEFFEHIIKNLCTKVRFLSIISVNSEYFIPMINEIFSEIGLVVRLERILKHKKGDYGIIINFSKDKLFVNSNKFSRNHIILNFGAEITNNNQNAISITDVILKSKNKDISKHSWAVNPSFCEALAYKFTGLKTKDRNMLIKNYGRILSGFKAAGYEISSVKDTKGEIRSGILADYGERIKPKIV